MSNIEVVKCGSVNCFVIEGSLGAVLVDTGVEKYREYLLDKVKQYNIKLIILTHGHLDHISNAKFLADYFKAKIAMNKEDIALIKDNNKREIYSNGLLGYILKKVSLVSMKKTKIEEFEPDIYLEDNDDLSEYGIEGKIISLKGHTKGSIGLIINQNQAIVGDTLIDIIKPAKGVLAENFADLNKSLLKLKKFKIEKAYVGHGKEISGKKLAKIFDER